MERVDLGNLGDLFLLFVYRNTPHEEYRRLPRSTQITLTPGEVVRRKSGR